MMEYKGYLGTVEYDAEAKIFHGDIINTRDVITFQGKSVNEIEKAFKDSIDDYIAWCNRTRSLAKRGFYPCFFMYLCVLACFFLVEKKHFKKAFHIVHAKVSATKFS